MKKQVVNLVVVCVLSTIILSRCGLPSTPDIKYKIEHYSGGEIIKTYIVDKDNFRGCKYFSEKCPVKIFYEGNEITLSGNIVVTIIRPPSECRERPSREKMYDTYENLYKKKNINN